MIVVFVLVDVLFVVIVFVFRNFCVVFVDIIIVWVVGVDVVGFVIIVGFSSVMFVNLLLLSMVRLFENFMVGGGDSVVLLDVIGVNVFFMFEMLVVLFWFCGLVMLMIFILVLVLFLVRLSGFRLWVL